ncbi:Eaf7p KNAG_0I02290 [Huiozyma naganishii CBS 8797]|uniref:Chromatin modification-related protein EAF7 n=1 Tax=Huiozyma naganishii (strain ATCC MYA-139 / BCRC 22969 / CBS 8797 / KCTC 17520 / NBRC 10181 / NCYC 3082 / Yp74L-3) TaxID=1071383 RepID=J7RAX6_HUIN7|nr:hypothetical protein KNAG_0I02290 [Kazachstania naganishii CBS 8797]CCK72015.1 hypothetical protein KNAG_0I02290 [Kazachstania naganishii CBS 8797]
MVVEWSVVDEIRLLRWVAEFKPVGVHKHFHMVCILERMNNAEKYPVVTLQKEVVRQGKTFSARDLWEKLSGYYNLQEADLLELQTGLAGLAPEMSRDFSLPWDEYGELILVNAKNGGHSPAAKAESVPETSELLQTQKSDTVGPPQDEVGPSTSVEQSVEPTVSAKEEESQEAPATTEEPIDREPSSPSTGLDATEGTPEQVESAQTQSGPPEAEYPASSPAVIPETDQTQVEEPSDEHDDGAHSRSVSPERSEDSGNIARRIRRQSVRLREKSNEEITEETPETSGATPLEKRPRDEDLSSPSPSAGTDEPLAKRTRHSAQTQEPEPPQSPPDKKRLSQPKKYPRRQTQPKRTSSRLRSRK